MSSTSIYSPQHIHSRYVQLAQLLRPRGLSAPYGRTVLHTSNGYIDRLKPVRTVKKVKDGRSALLGRTVRDLATWNNKALVSQSNSSELSAIHGWMVRTWTTYRLAKKPGRSVVQGLKNTLSLPNSIHLMQTVQPPGPDGPQKGDRDRRPADLSGRVAGDPVFWPEQYTDHRENRFCASSKES
jgi:hypothetical protein